MHDAVMTAFLHRQYEEALALAHDSDLVDIVPHGGTPPDRYLVHFSCTGLVQAANGSIVEANDFVVGIAFPAGYLRAAEPHRVVTWLDPLGVWHPNIAGRAQLMCIGRLRSGTSLVDLIYQCWEIITWNKVTMREDDALNRAACEWARRNRARFPVDRRPLKRRPAAHVARDLAAEAHDARA